MHKVFLRPMNVDRMPKMQFPRMAPIEKYDPSQEVSVKLIGPACSGDSADCSPGNAGDSHPMAHPWHKLMIFAILFLIVQNKHKIISC